MLSAYPSAVRRWIETYYWGQERLHVKVHADAQTGAVSTFASGLAAPVDLRVGADGALYYLERGATGGRVGRIAPAAPVSQPNGTPARSPAPPPSSSAATTA